MKIFLCNLFKLLFNWKTLLIVLLIVICYFLYGIKSDIVRIKREVNYIESEVSSIESDVSDIERWGIDCNY